MYVPSDITHGCVTSTWQHDGVDLKLSVPVTYLLSITDFVSVSKECVAATQGLRVSCSSSDHDLSQYFNTYCHMARSKQTARRSTGGRAPIRTVWVNRVNTIVFSLEQVRQEMRNWSEQQRQDVLNCAVLHECSDVMSLLADSKESRLVDAFVHSVKSSDGMEAALQLVTGQGLSVEAPVMLCDGLEYHCLLDFIAAADEWEEEVESLVDGLLEAGAHVTPAAVARAGTSRMLQHLLGKPGITQALLQQALVELVPNYHSDMYDDQPGMCWCAAFRQCSDVPLLLTAAHHRGANRTWFKALLRRLSNCDEEGDDCVIWVEVLEGMWEAVTQGG